MAGQGRLAGFGPVAVLDIGSNSVRLVVYERLARALTPLYNEKVLCGLGRGLAETGRLQTESMERAFDALARFKQLGDQMRIKALHVLATAAVREAKNGDVFITKAEAILGAPLRILSGPEEAHYAALGVRSGFWPAEGVAGDLGGGSLELVSVEGERIDSHSVAETHPLGVIRLAEEAKGRAGRAFELAKQALAGSPAVAAIEGRSLFLIGGTWRNLAKLHMAESSYPLLVMHGYTLEPKKLARFCRHIVEGRLNHDPAWATVSRSRRTLLPIGAAVLQALIEVGKPRQIAISALGLREGFLFEQLAPEHQQTDPLLVASEELAILRSRSPAHAKELAQWTGTALLKLGVEETADEARLRKAACLLADIGWRAHPDYRGTQSLNIITHAAFVGIDHPGRVFLALANYYRHEGLDNGAIAPEVLDIATPQLLERAKLIGALFRVAYALTASMPGVLPDTEITIERSDGDSIVTVHLPTGHAGLEGERPRKRVGQLAKLLGHDDGRLVVG